MRVSLLSCQKLKVFLVAMRLGGTPVPIPNTTVKTQAADGTARQRGRAGGRQIKKRRFIRDPNAWEEPCSRMADEQPDKSVP